jgi:hypothetical protein
MAPSYRPHQGLLYALPVLARDERNPLLTVPAKAGEKSSFHFGNFAGEPTLRPEGGELLN